MNTQNVTDKQKVKIDQKTYLRDDVPPMRELPWLGIQMMLTMFTATVLVAVLTKFDVGTTLLTSGLGTIVALLVTKRRIPMYYGSSFSYIAVISTVMSLYDKSCFSAPYSQVPYCPDGVRLVQVGILGTAVLEIALGFLVMRVGKATLDKVLSPVVAGTICIVIAGSLFGSALNNASGTSISIPANQAWKCWLVAFITLAVILVLSTFIRKGFLAMIPILIGTVVGYLISIPFGLVSFSEVATAPWVRLPNVTFPAFSDPRAWSAMASIAFIAIAILPEATAHLYQLSLYLDELADQVGHPKFEIEKLVGLNFAADGFSDIVAGFLGGTAGTSYGECNSLMAIIRNYSSAVIVAAGLIAIVLGFVGKLGVLVNTMPVAVQGGLGIYLFGVIAMQGIALLVSHKVNVFDPKVLGVGATILVLGIGGSLWLPSGMYPFHIPILFPYGIPAIVFSAIVGIALNLILPDAPVPDVPQPSLK